MFIVSLFFQLVRLLVLVIIRGLIGGGILQVVSGVFKIEKSDFSECFSVSVFAHAVEIIFLTLLNGFAHIYMLFDPSFNGIYGIGSLYGTSQSVVDTIFRAVVLTLFYTYFTAKFMSTSPGKSFLLSLVSVILYFLLATLFGFILSHLSPLYAIGPPSRLF